jgi:hypothetical protein
MHDIDLIESFQTNAKNDIIVTAIVEDMVYVRGSQTYIDPPEYAPARCTITIPNDHLPPDINLDGASEEDLEEIVNKHINLNNYDWVITVEEDDDIEPEPRYSNLYF